MNGYVFNTLFFCFTLIIKMFVWEVFHCSSPYFLSIFPYKTSKPIIKIQNTTQVTQHHLSISLLIFSSKLYLWTHRFYLIYYCYSNHIYGEPYLQSHNDIIIYIRIAILEVVPTIINCSHYYEHKTTALYLLQDKEINMLFMWEKRSKTKIVGNENIPNKKLQYKLYKSK